MFLRNFAKNDADVKIVKIILLAVVVAFTLPMNARTPSCLRADTLFSEYKYSEALHEYIAAYDGNISTMKSEVAINAAIAAAQCDMDSLAVELVSRALNADSVFFDERISVTELLQDCRLLPQWDSFQNENERRLAIAYTGYDISLRNILLDIYHTDQNPRGHIITISKSDPQNSEALSRYWKEMQRNDSINLVRTVELLDTHGWIPKSKVGTANQALFFVIQHAAPDIIDRYIALFETAAENNEIPRNLFAKMYDRQRVYAGKPQKYGTQKVRKSQDSKEMVIWQIEDPDHVNALRKEMELPPLDEYPR